MQRWIATVALAGSLLGGSVSAAPVATTISDVAPAGHATNGINSLSLTRNNLVSVGDWQFAAFYGALVCDPRPCRAPIQIARRSLKGGDWTVRATPFSIEDAYSNTGVRDDHNVVAMGIDAKGVMHLTWGMHNAPLAYATTTASVTGQTFGASAGLAFGYRLAMTGEEESAVTYPEFFHLKGSRDLFFTYRQGGAGGGSGNGNQYINRFDASGRWRRVASPMVDGVSSSMNAYLNTFAQAPSGALLASWTIRESPDWQTNHDLYAARSTDQGATWRSTKGARLGPPITRENADALARIVALPTKSSLINQTSTAVDSAGRPMLATWWAPGAAKGDHTRQYMLVWQDAAGAWITAQVSNRAAGEAYDATAAKVREMGRPIVLVDKAGRVLVVTRASDAGKPVTDASNRLAVYWSKDRKTWTRVELSDVNLGTYEPSYDRALWEKENRLSLFFQPVGLGQPASPVRVLDWDAAAFFDAGS